MKLREWFKSKSTQELLMYAVIAMLVIMIATRWGYISRTAGESVKRRFIPPQEQDAADSTATFAPEPQANAQE